MQDIFWNFSNFFRFYPIWVGVIFECGNLRPPKHRKLRYSGSKNGSRKDGITMARRGENIRKRKDGRWEGRYIKDRTTDGQAKYGSVYANSYLEVKAKLLAVKSVGEQKKTTKTEQNITLREALALWSEHHKPKLRQQTYNKYARLIERHLTDGIGRCAVTRLEAKAVNAFLDEKQKYGRLADRKPLSGGYVKMMRYLILSALRHVEKQACSPVLDGEVMQYHCKKTDCRVLSQEEQVYFERFLRREMDKTKLGVLLCLQLGLRIGELCGLRWGDVDFNLRTITIFRSLQRIENPDKSIDAPKTILAVLEPKTEHSHRVIPLPAHFLSLLKRFYPGHLGGYVIAESGHCVEPRTMRNRFQRLLEECGLPNVNFHALRHSFATNCVENGMDIKSLSELLGHANVQITLNTYVHPSLEQKRRQLEQMASVRGQNRGQEKPKTVDTQGFLGSLSTFGMKEENLQSVA
jgi:YD repeat-containing protein